MAISIVHAFVSAKANGSDATLVQPADWNASHTITLAAGKVLGRNAATAGAVEELAFSYTAGASGTGTGAWTGAVGTTAQRPASPSAGMERWNSTAAAKELYNGTSWLSLLAAGAITSFAPTGRLTLESGVPVSTSDKTGKATVYYTPAGVGYAQYPSYDGTTWSVKTFSELSNDLTQSSTNKAGAAAAGPYEIHDCFVWDDAGTNRLTRGPKWIASSTATITNATPAVVTWTAHGLWDGATVRFTTTGALPTGLTASTDYFLRKVDANTFKLSTTLANQVAGTFIATSSAGSGDHTAFNYTSVRGTGAATTEIERVNGIWVNKYDITNGPAAQRGTYVGSIYTNASSQIDFKLGTVAASWGEAVIGIWNAYNRIGVRGRLGSTTDSYTYFTAAWRAAEGSPTSRISVVAGLSGEPLSAVYSSYKTSGATSGTIAGVSINTTNSFSGLPAYVGTSVSAMGYGAADAIVFGFGYATAGEQPWDTGGLTSYGDTGQPTKFQMGLRYEWSY